MRRVSAGVGLALLGLAAVPAPTATGFNAVAALPNGVAIPYRVDASFLLEPGLSLAELHQSEFAWDAQGGNAYVDFFQNDVLGGQGCATGTAPCRRVTAAQWDGPGGDDAVATFPCGDICELRFDNEADWNVLEQQGLGVQEFGHWIGLDHSDDRPSTDPSIPSMRQASGIFARDVAQDDANGLHTARPRFPIMSANDSFEYTTPFYGFLFRPGPGGGSWTRYCNDVAPAYNGVCFVQFNGGGQGGASYYQDIFDRGYRRNNLRARIRLRNRGSQTVNAEVVVWFLQTGGKVTGGNCALAPTSTTWTQCYAPSATSTFNLPAGVVQLRIEVYNKGPYNMDVDTQILGWP